MARALLIITLVCAIAAGAWYYRSNTFACGQFDLQNNCLSHVSLDTEALGIQNPRVGIDSIDLSASATQAVIALKGEKERTSTEATDDYAALILFDTKTGEAIKVLRELWGDGTDFTGVAFSKDGSLVASYGYGETQDSNQDNSNENSLLVQKTSGEVIYTVFSYVDNNVHDCVRQLEFSDDNKFLQCSTTLFNLEEGTSRFYGEDELPRLANFSAGSNASSATGVKTKRGETNNVNVVMEFPDGSEQIYPRSKYSIDNYSSIVFSTDGQAFLDLETQADKELSILQRLGIVPSTQATIWSLDGNIQTQVQLTQPVFEIAWSKDSKHYALLGEDLSLSVFNVQ